MTFNLGAALAVFLAAGAIPGGTVATTPATSQQIQVPVIEPVALKSLMTSGRRVTIIDVRQPNEFLAGHIDGAMLMPYQTLGSSYSRLPKEADLVVYCGDGVRSAKVVSFLLAHGYRHVVSLNGGYRAWTAMV